MAELRVQQVNVCFRLYQLYMYMIETCGVVAILTCMRAGTVAAVLCLQTMSTSVKVRVGTTWCRVDHSRVADVGPDRAAAEWVLHLGGSVMDYNRMPAEH